MKKKPRILQKRKANPIDQQFQPFSPQSWMVNVRSMQEDNRIDQLIIVETTLFFSIIHLKTEEENDTKKLIKSFSFVDNSYHKHVNSSINMPNVLPKLEFFC